MPKESCFLHFIDLFFSLLIGPFLAFVYTVCIEERSENSLSFKKEQKNNQ